METHHSGFEATPLLRLRLDQQRAPLGVLASKTTKAFSQKHQTCEKSVAGEVYPICDRYREKTIENYDRLRTHRGRCRRRFVVARNELREHVVIWHRFDRKLAAQTARKRLEQWSENGSETCQKMGEKDPTNAPSLKSSSSSSSA